MRIEYTLTLADYKAAQRLHNRQRIGRRIQFYWWYAAVPVLAILGLASFILLDINRMTKYAAIFFGIECGLIGFSVLLPITRFYSIRKGFTLMFPPASKDRSASLDIEDGWILSAIPGVSEGKFFWNAIVDFAQDERVTLFYVRKNRFLVLPTPALDSVQRVELNDLVSRNLVKR